MKKEQCNPDAYPGGEPHEYAASEAMAIQKPFRLTYFSERSSHFGVYWDPRRDIGWMGVDQLQVFGTRWNIPGGCPLKFVLRDEDTGAVLGLAEDGTETRRISYYPHQVVIESTLPGYRVQQTISFSECDRMVIGVEVTALGTARTCRLLAYGGGENEAACPCGENGVTLRYPFGDDPDMQAKHLATRGPIDLAVLSQAPLEWHIGIPRTALAAIKHNTLAGDSVQSHDSSMNVDASQIDKLFYVTPRSGSCYIALSQPAKLVPGKSRRFVFALEMSYEQKRATVPSAPSAAELKRARRYWQQILRALPEGTKADNNLMVRAVGTLESVRWKGVAGYKPYEASFPTKGWYNAHWLWDSCFHALGYAFYDIEVARDQVRLLLAYQDPKSGLVPALVNEYHTPRGSDQVVCSRMEWTLFDGTQPPVIAWTAWMLHRATPDLDFLAAVYPRLKKYARFWDEHRLDADHQLYHWADDAEPDINQCESGWDNSPRWDKGCKVLLAIDLNCHLVVQRRALARIAEALGKKREAARWSARADDLAQRVDACLFDEKNGRYADRHRTTGAFSDVFALSSFLPLWAGIPAKERAQAIVRKDLLSKDRFWPALPVLDYSDPRHETTNYWRGPVWANIAWFITCGLAQYGFRKEARQASRYFVKGVRAGKHFGEYYDSRSQESIGRQQYGWTAAFTMLHLQRMYEAGNGCAG